MAKKDTTNTTADAATTENVVAGDSVVENKNVDQTSNKTRNKNTSRKAAALDDSEEIEVISLIPHVSYLDKRTGDMYEWEESGHSEFMTVETLKDMWRNHKGYFRNLWLKPLDERIIDKFGLTKFYNEYEFLMNESSYTKDNITNLLTVVGKIKMGTRFAIVDKIKQLISDGVITDITVIKALSNKLNVDFIAFS